MEKRSDGLINPNNINNNVKRTNQVKEVKFGGDGLMERTVGKVVTEDGRELLKEDDLTSKIIF